MHFLLSRLFGNLNTESYNFVSYSRSTDLKRFFHFYRIVFVQEYEKKNTWQGLHGKWIGMFIYLILIARVFVPAAWNHDRVL